MFSYHSRLPAPAALSQWKKFQCLARPTSRPTAREWGGMDELVAAAAVVSIVIDANADGVVGQRGTGVTVSTDDAAMPAAETLTEDTRRMTMVTLPVFIPRMFLLRYHSPQKCHTTHHERSTSLLSDGTCP